MKRSKELDSCIYYFFHEDENRIKRKKKITYKINYYDFFIKNELTNIERIHKISDYKTMFYICEKSTDLKIAHYEDNLNNLASVLALKKDISNDNTVLLKYEDIELIYLKTYLKALSSPRIYIYTLIEFYRHLFRSIQVLSANQIVHNNISFDNIYVHNNIPFISHFSFSIDLSRSDIGLYIKQFFSTYDPSYFERPLELHILSYLLTNKLNSLSQLNIEDIINNFLKNHYLLHAFGDVSSYKDEAIQYFTKYVNQTYEYIIDDILTYGNTWDQYALSIMFLRILIYLHRSMKIQNKFIILFMKLLVTNISLSPSKRGSIQETTNKFEVIIDSLNPKDFKDIIQNIVI